MDAGPAGEDAATGTGADGTAFDEAATAESATAEPAPRSLRERLLRPTLPELWLFLAISLPVLGALVASLPTLDLTYQLRAGADILAGRGIPAVDTWTFTAAGEPWLDQQWGAQAILAAIYAVSGWNGLAIFRAALVGLYAGLLLLAIHRRAPGSSGRGSAILVIAAFLVTTPALGLRPQLLGMVCFAAVLVLLAGRREHPRIAWLVPVIAITWANLHGSFILAPVLVGFAWLEDIAERSPRAARTSLLGVVTTAATLITPFGLDAWRYAAGLAGNPDVRGRITEWQPTTPTDVTGILFWGSVVVVLILVLRQTRTPGVVTWPAVVTLVAFAALGAVAARGIAWWPAVAIVTLTGIAVHARVAEREARGLPPETAAAPPRQRPAVGNSWNNHIALTIVAGCLTLLPIWRPVNTITGAPRGLLSYAPVGVTAILRMSVSDTDRIWNAQAWGSWLEFAIPGPTYAFDSRVEVIPAQAWADGDTVLSASAGWADILDRYAATVVVTEGPLTTPLATALAAEARWRLFWADDEGTVWRRAPEAAASAGLSSAS
jgi:hypothetical protein